MQREKLFKCLVSLQFLHTKQKNKYIVNLYQKELFGCFSEDMKMWPSHNVWNWCTQDVLIRRRSQQSRLPACDVNQSISVLTNSYSLVYILHCVSAVTP